MPLFTAATELACPPAAAFDFLIRPKNLEQVTPPDYHAELLDGPDVLALGSRITVRIRRYGISQTMSSEVTAFDPANFTLTDEQRQGPFRHFKHTHTAEATPTGCRLTDAIDFAPPGGLLGLVATAARIEADLASAFAYRTAKFQELLNGRGA